MRYALILFGFLFFSTTVFAESGISFYLVHPNNDQLIKDKVLDVRDFVKMKSVDKKTVYWVSKTPLMQVSRAQKVEIKDPQPVSEEMKKLVAMKRFRVVDPPKDKKNIYVILTPEDSQAFFKLTSEHVKQQVAVVLNGVALSAPRIFEPIASGSVQINNMTPQIAQKISELAK